MYVSMHECISVYFNSIFHQCILCESHNVTSIDTVERLLTGASLQLSKQQELHTAQHNLDPYRRGKLCIDSPTP